MSGGCFDYLDDELKSEIFGCCCEKAKNIFEDREISQLIWEVLDLIHEFDWYKSEDTCKDRYLEEKAAFKKRWFSNRGVRVKRIVDESVADLKRELYETFNIKE